MLSVLILLPFVGAAIIGLLSTQLASIARKIALVVAISTLADQPTNLVFDKASTNKANAAKVFFTLYKGNTGVLDVELRYGGNFKAMPRFHANMHPDFVKIIKKNVHVLDPL